MPTKAGMNWEKRWVWRLWRDEEVEEEEEEADEEVARRVQWKERKADEN